jgi:two-component system, NarL family, response regulator DesR
VIRTLIAESNALVRVGLSALLAREPDMEVVTELDRLPLVLPAARALQPDVALLDAGMAAPEGFATVRALRTAVPECGSVVMASTTGRAWELREAVAACAEGIVRKDSDPVRITEAIRRVAAGRKAVDPDLAYSVLNSGDNPLTPRELDVLSLVAEGASAPEIAGDLYLSVGTVRNYLSRVIRKTGARNRVDAIRIAGEAGWLLPRPAGEPADVSRSR